MSTDSQQRTGYQVIARKWRPQRFAEVVGQEHVTRTLQNAFAHGRVGHAYLFTGPRGIGKTTSARIFAKLLNCERPDGLEPCCECDLCRAISAGRCLDVIEIDAASNTGVDNIRELRETVRYTPAQGKVKVYIIDEVHMLSKAAWNALLKTLEEPPPHVKFVLATTEPHKVLPTIVSRCQRLDFRRIPAALIVQQLQKIVQTEGICAEPGALSAIARVADGAMRDAQSLLDQMIAFRGGRSPEETIREQDVIDVFGLASATELCTLVRGILQNDFPACLRIIGDLADRGRDLERVLADAVRFTRNALVAVMCGDQAGDLLDVSDAEMENIREAVRDGDADRFQRILDGLLAAEPMLRQALNKRVCLEAAVARIVRDVHGVRIEDVIERLAGVAGASGGRSETPPRRTNAAAAPPESGSRTGSPGTAAAPHAPPIAGTSGRQGATRARTAGGEVRESAPAAPQPTKASGGEAGDGGASPTPGSVADSAEKKTVSRQRSAPPAAAPPARTRSGPVESANPTDAAGTAAVEAGIASPEMKPPPAPAAPQDENESESVAESGERAAPEPADLWHALVKEVGRIPEQKALHRVLQKLRPLDYRNGILEAAVDEQVDAEEQVILDQPDVQRVLDECFRRIGPAGSRGRVLIKKWIPGMSDERRRLRPSPEVRKKVEANPFVQQVCKMFGAAIVDVRG